MNVLVKGNEIKVASELGLFQYNTDFIPPITPTWEKETALKEKIYSIFPGRTGMYLSSYYNGFFQEVQGTDFWIPKFQNLKEKLVHTILETEEGVLFVSSDNGIFKSTDTGETWKGVFVENSIKSIFVEGNVLVASSPKGLLRSTDMGESWNWVLINSGSIIKTRPIKGGFIAVTQSVESRSEIGFETIKNNLFFSFDQGKTWQRIKGSPQFENIFDMEQAGDFLYCSHKNGISRSSDGGKTWELVHPPFSERNWAMLAASGNVIFVVMFAGC